MGLLWRRKGTNLLRPHIILRCWKHWCRNLQVFPFFVIQPEGTGCYCSASTLFKLLIGMERELSEKRVETSLEITRIQKLTRFGAIKYIQTQQRGWRRQWSGSCFIGSECQRSKNKCLIVSCISPAQHQWLLRNSGTTWNEKYALSLDYARSQKGVWHVVSGGALGIYVPDGPRKELLEAKKTEDSFQKTWWSSRKQSLPDFRFEKLRMQLAIFKGHQSSLIFPAVIDGFEAHAQGSYLLLQNVLVKMKNVF